MTRASRAIIIGALLIGVATVLAGCSNHDGKPGDEHIRALLEQSLGEMTDDNVTADTRATFEQAARDGVPITFEQVRTAQLAAVDCLRELGFNVITSEDAMAPGGIGYVYGIPGRAGDFPPELETAGEECESHSVMWLELAFQATNAPEPVDQEELFAPYRAAMVQCIRERGGVIDDDPSLDDAMTVDADLKGDPPCFIVVGLDRALSGR